MTETAPRKTSLLVTCLYAVAIGINVYRIADTLSDGKVSRELSLALTRWKGQAGYKLAEYKAERKARSYVIWEAIQTVEGNTE